MKVNIKSFNVDMEIKQKGVELEIRKPDGKFLGDLLITKTRVVWCPGKTDPAHGKSISWDKFIKLMDDL